MNSTSHEKVANRVRSEGGEHGVEDDSCRIWENLDICFFDCPSLLSRSFAVKDFCCQASCSVKGIRSGSDIKGSREWVGR